MGGVFKNVPTSVGSNRANSSQLAPDSKKSRTSIIHNDIIPANTTRTISAPGTQFYLLAATAGLNIRPRGGVYNTYTVGKGLALDEINSFAALDIQNTTANPVVMSIFVGFDNFIDNTLIINSVTNPNVAFPTCPKPNVQTVVDITDKSGTAFQDINGNNWYAISRVAIVISNTDTGVTLLLQKAASTTSNDNAIIAIFPATSIRLDVSGNYRLNLGGGVINAIVSEIYQALPAT